MTESENGRISEEDLHAYVDGHLPPERCAAVETWLAANPEVAAEIAGWRSQNEGIRALFATSLEPVEWTAPVHAPRFGRPLSLSPLIAALAASLLLLLGGGIGAYLAGGFGPHSQQLAVLEDLPLSSRTNYLVYASEVRHPVEVRADEEAHLVAWLSKRLGSSLVAPSLTAEGYSLVGGRLVSFAGGPGALLMYEDAQGGRVTLLAGRNNGNSATGFLFDRSGDVRTFYWIDQSLGYALSGAVDRERLEALAQEIYQQL